MRGEQTKGSAKRRGLDFAGFAQEFLRRNPAYRRDYQSISRVAPSTFATAAQEDMARRWGLCFPLFARGRPG